MQVLVAVQAGTLNPTRFNRSLARGGNLHLGATAALAPNAAKKLNATFKKSNSYLGEFLHLTSPV